MSKKRVIIICETLQRGKYYFEDYLLPIIGEVEHKEPYKYETKEVIFRILNFSDNLRGLNADLVFVENWNKYFDYEDIVLSIVRYDRNKINVVL